MRQAGDDVIAYRLWARMSREGVVKLELLDADQRRVAGEMMRRGLVWFHADEMLQVNAPLERWAGLA